MDISQLDAPAPIPFNASPNPTLGAEIELQILDPATFNLKQGSTLILDRVGDHPKIKQELTQSTVEVITGVCDSVADIEEDLGGTLRDLYGMADELGLTFSSAGPHPFGQWRDQKIYPNDRYQHLRPPCPRRNRLWREGDLDHERADDVHPAFARPERVVALYGL